MAKIVVALGGNALGNSPEEQLRLVKHTAKSLVALIKKGHEIVVSHGNGPQVGAINLGMNFAAESGQGTNFPFSRMWGNEPRIHRLSSPTEPFK